MTMAHFLHQNFILVRTDPREPTPPPSAAAQPRSLGQSHPHRNFHIMI